VDDDDSNKQPSKIDFFKIRQEGLLEIIYILLEEEKAPFWEIVIPMIIE